MKGKLFKGVTTSLVASVIAMSTATALLPAFAVETTDPPAAGDSTTATADKKITINNATNGSTYTAYQIFSGEVTSLDGKNALRNIAWGSAITNGDEFIEALKNDTIIGNKFTTATTASDVADALDGITNDSDEAKAFANIAKRFVNDGKSATAADGKCEIGGLEDGYYIVLDETSNLTGYTKAIPILLLAGGNADYTEKSGSTTSKKTIVAVDGNKTNVGADNVTAVAGVGSTITYQIEVDLPENYADFNGYALYFHDILPEELTLDIDSISLWIDDTKIGDNITATQPSGWTPYYALFPTEEESGNNLYVYILDLKQIVPDATADNKIKLQYTTTVNSTATADEAIVNEANVLYPSDPGHGGWPEWDPDGPPDPENPDDPNNEDPKVPGDPDYPWNDDLPGDPDPEEPDDPDTPPPPSRDPENPPPSDPDNPDDYDPDEEDTMTNTTPDTTSTWVFEIDMEKTDGKTTPKKLENVGFTITNDAGKVAIFAGGYKFVAFVSAEDAEDLDAWADDDDNKALLEDIFGEDYADVELSAEVLTDEDGKLVLDGLAPGTYTFSETSPIDGYNSVSDFTVTLTAAQTTNGSYTGALAGTTTDADFVNDEGNIGDVIAGTIVGGVANLTVIDPPASILPGTGGAGVYFYYIVGGSLVALSALGLIYAKRRKDEEKA